MLKIVLLIVCVGGSWAQEASNGTELPSPIVTIKQGTLKGVAAQTIFGRNYYSFKGIRYAEPPIGDLRFKATVPPKEWNGTYDATEDGPACPQPLLEGTNEDCLFINVHTPKLPKNRRNPKNPVILYIHPGSLNVLTGNSAMVGANYILQHDVVFVSFNYRLAGLGYLSTGDEHAIGNYGMKDQVQAMRWVKENIAAFGGNPNRVTLAGYSAGGLVASIHMVSPMSRGLFQQVMIMSGSISGNSYPLTNLLELSKKQAQLVGCPDDTSENLVDCLKNVSAEVIGNSLEGFRVFGNDPQFFWQFVVEPDFGQERFLTEDPQISIQCGKVVDVPVMTGMTLDELVSLAYPVVQNQTWLDVLNANYNSIAPYAFYYNPNTSLSDNRSDAIKSFYFENGTITPESLVALGQVYSDSLSGFAVNRGAQLLSYINRKPVYYYVFTYKGRYSNYPGGSGQYVVHFDDLLYVFWNSLQFPLFNKTDPEVTTVKRMTKLYANFARTGNPTPNRSPSMNWVHWNKFTVRNKKYLEIGDRLRMKSNIFPDRYAFWNQLLPLPKCPKA